MQELWEKLKEENESENERILKSIFSEEAYNIAIEDHNKFFTKIGKIKQGDFSGLHKFGNPITKAQKPYVGFNE